jgi:hypothetical protein
MYNPLQQFWLANFGSSLYMVELSEKEFLQPVENPGQLISRKFPTILALRSQ